MQPGAGEAEGGAGVALRVPQAERFFQKATVHGVNGKVVAEVRPVPDDVASLKQHIEQASGCPVGLQKLVEFNGTRIFSDPKEKLPQESIQFLMVVDETPLYTWSISTNPCREMLAGEGGVVESPKLTRDYLNVLTQEPVRSGRHYFKFVMHKIGDEQWCGLVDGFDKAGPYLGGRQLHGWTYYCGRMRNVGTPDIMDGLGALHAAGYAVKKFKKLQPSGDVIGMLVDLDDACAVAFDLNGQLQGACPIPKKPLWVITHMDDEVDKVELQKPNVAEAPAASVQALTGKLLDVTKGRNLGDGFERWLDSDSDWGDVELSEENRRAVQALSRGGAGGTAAGSGQRPDLPARGGPGNYERWVDSDSDWGDEPGPPPPPAPPPRREVPWVPPDQWSIPSNDSD